MSKNEPWPSWASSWALPPAACACWSTSSIPRRVAPVESSAPHFTSDSIAFLLTARESTRRQKSQIEVKRPSSSRARMIASTAAEPTFLTASSPKRMQPSATTKPWSDTLTSGGRTSMPISSQRETKNGTLSLVDMTEEISAAMYSAG